MCAVVMLGFISYCYWYGIPSSASDLIILGVAMKCLLLALKLGVRFQPVAAL